MSAPETPAVTPGQAARDMDIAFAVVAADRNTLREVLRRIALGQERDPSVAADKALTESRKRGDAVAARQPQPAPGDVPAGIRSAVTGLIGMWDGMRKVHAPSDGEWEDWRAVLGGLVEELASQLDAIDDAKPAPGLRADLEETLASWRDNATYRVTDTRDEITEHHAVTECADTLAGILADHPETTGQPAPGCPDPSQHVVIRDFLTGRELPHAETDGPQPARGDDPELTEHVSVRFPAGMIAVAKQLAAAEGMTVSAWIRREIEREATRREQPAPELAAAIPAAQAALARVLSWLKPEDKFDSYRYARATRAQLASAYRDGGLDVPEELRRFL